MSETAEDLRQVYHVVLNDEEQYSIWPADRELPAGWRAEGTSGSEQECLEHIEQVWTDMRPASLRRFMAEHADDVPAADDLFADEGPTLVDRLSQGEHPVEASLRPERSLTALREALDRGYVFVRFTGTEGGTELGVQLDGDVDLAGADFAAASGTVALTGTLTLDFEPVRCHAKIDLATLAGTGRLERVGEH